MIEVKGNIWDYKADAILITTNGDITKKKLAVMGRGIALQAAQKYGWIKRLLADHIRVNGNHFGFINRESFIKGKLIYSFPTKHHWREKADLELINRSAHELAIEALNSPNLIFVLPRPGCSNGQLKWEDVKPILEFLPDNVHIIDL